MKKYQLCAAVFWVSLSVFVSLYAYRLGIGNFANPGSGFFPFYLGLSLFIIAGIVITQILIKTRVHEIKKDEQPANFLKVIAALAVLFAYAFLLEVLGFLLTTFVVLAILFRIGGYNKMIPIFAYSAATVIITYLLFNYLGVQFPTGVFRLLGF